MWQFIKHISNVKVLSYHLNWVLLISLFLLTQSTQHWLCLWADMIQIQAADKLLRVILKFWSFFIWRINFFNSTLLQLYPRPREAYKSQCLAITVKYSGGSAMTKGCFSDVDLGRFFKSCTKLSNTCSVCLSALTMLANSGDCFFLFSFVFFQQNNAPCHTGWLNKVWMKYHQFKSFSWSAQSPNLNLSKKTGQEEVGRDRMKQKCSFYSYN